MQTELRHNVQIGDLTLSGAKTISGDKGLAAEVAVPAGLTPFTFTWTDGETNRFTCDAAHGWENAVPVDGVLVWATGAAFYAGGITIYSATEVQVYTFGEYSDPAVAPQVGDRVWISVVAHQQPKPVWTDAGLASVALPGDAKLLIISTNRDVRIGISDNYVGWWGVRGGMLRGGESCVCRAEELLLPLGPHLLNIANTDDSNTATVTVAVLSGD
jgi:hypothetical protein